MEAVSTSETSVNFYKTTRRNNPEDSHIYTRRENLKSRLLIYGLFNGNYNSSAYRASNDRMTGDQ
jgi:hypothetical protein